MLGHNKVDGRVKACLRRYRVSYNFILGPESNRVSEIVTIQDQYDLPLSISSPNVAAHYVEGVE